MPNLKTLPELKNWLLDRKSSTGASWSEIAAEFYPDENPKVWRSILWRIAKANYEPKNNKLRSRLGLPYIKVIPACPICNEIHLSGCPVSNNLPTRNKTKVVPVCELCGEVHLKRHPKRVSRPRRVAIRCDNMTSAARTILNNLDPPRVKELLNEIERLEENDVR